MKHYPHQHIFTQTMLVISMLMAGISTASYAQDDAKVKLDFRLRYESVEQKNPLKDADALTLRTLLSYSTASFNNISGYVEFEDSRAVGIDDYNDTLGHKPNYSVIADPETTELDQAYVQYKASNWSTKLGRQVIALDNQRFVGHVGWRQDKQTFDALSVNYQASAAVNLTYAYVNKRNRIFAEDKDLHVKDHLINLTYKTNGVALTGYGYLLEVDEGVSNSLDTYGVRYSGSEKFASGNLIYALEWATQEAKSTGANFDADYQLIELGYGVEGVTIKGGYELLGSDGGDYGFQTPLATLHAFNGWSDQFLSTPKQGLRDIYASVSGKAYGGKWAVFYHTFDADKATDNADDFGDEINASYQTSFNKTFSGGIKYASYSAGDSATGKVDTDKLWIWVGAKF
ncbi:alginate export family protein [Colwellia sp. MEBiC06753]